MLDRASPVSCAVGTTTTPAFAYWAVYDNKSGGCDSLKFNEFITTDEKINGGSTRVFVLGTIMKTMEALSWGRGRLDRVSCRGLDARRRQ